ncbi:acyl-CoA Delta(11) desaturase-like [Agrilus planipennis]|uniref:Acyl-CoA Delta(11) desaturase-like n=1 Tax=Agrilus planipennis TaxID=224129 RepID=A0A7F5R4J5_AGRPL|nr:acyl-CoA Delta(11) desaturase-like [Agrilus planipennis]
MSPNIDSATGVLHETDEEILVENPIWKEPDGRKAKLVWRNVIIFAYLHLAGLYGAYLMLTSAKWATCIWAYILYTCGGLGVTAGAHRLWAHRSYKAKWPLRLMLTTFNTLAFQVIATNIIYIYTGCSI